MTLVVLAIVIAALVLWKLRVVIALFFLGVVIASAMRPSVEWLHRRYRIPRGIGVIVHYLAFLVAIGLFLYLVVPTAITQIDHAIGQVADLTGSAPPRRHPLARDPTRDPQRARQAAATARRRARLFSTPRSP